MRPLRILLVCLLALGSFAAGPAAGTERRRGPCDLTRGDGETVRAHSRRLIRCAAERWEVPGGARTAICIAQAESHLDPEATSASGAYVGLFQHSAEAWPERYAEWTRPAWDLDESPLSGRTNAIVTMRMVNAGGWGAWADVGDCDPDPADR